ncbi:hypothetical protein F8388_016548 [Cannabis sativa]|uniref:Zinc knuckle CX2CX4HX4C domain-containing protein n=1 Tax=Cannabis sativa TaxID=3483 RepID=A0A7J6E4L6_CANSA|nr:hypothetical protein G4B88_018785 [Cannabis sativa]KAF4363420.1 hypothetical protein F8388_016548 [Cannabis sativa]KAF4373414.1 hypothetical protein G4B88_011683 [Cannabis sativa]
MVRSATLPEPKTPEMGGSDGGEEGPVVCDNGGTVGGRGGGASTSAMVFSAVEISWPEMEAAAMESRLRMPSNLLGTYVDVHEDSLNEGWGPFLRFRAILDISKPLLRGEMVKLKDSLDEFWLEFRYERLPEFCFECGTIGHPFESCHKFLEQIYNGNDPSLEYGPAMIGSPLPDSGYDRYRTDFFKGGAWPLMTRLAKNSFTAAIHFLCH